jgi:hypothetical protein
MSIPTKFHPVYVAPVKVTEFVRINTEDKAWITNIPYITSA